MFTAGDEDPRVVLGVSVMFENGWSFFSQILGRRSKGPLLRAAHFAGLLVALPLVGACDEEPVRAPPPTVVTTEPFSLEVDDLGLSTERVGALTCSARLNAGELSVTCHGGRGPVQLRQESDGEIAVQEERIGRAEIRPDLSEAVLAWLGGLALPEGGEAGRHVPLPAEEETFDPRISLSVSVDEMEGSGTVAPFETQVRSLVRIEPLASLAAQGSLRFGDEGEAPTVDADAVLWLAATAVEREDGTVGVDRQLRAVGNLPSLRAAGRVAVETSEFFASEKRCEGTAGQTRVSLGLRRERASIVVHDRLSGEEVARRVFEAEDECPSFDVSRTNTFRVTVEDDVIARWLGQLD